LIHAVPASGVVQGVSVRDGDVVIRAEKDQGSLAVRLDDLLRE
jgi:hypothetical protein